jgi:divalent metal cation (Fe/Co/Zn/Cd) transporter
VQFHALLTRQSGAERFISMHVLVPGGWTVQQGHGLLEQIEAEIRSTLANTTVITHLEAQEDPAAWDG